MNAKTDAEIIRETSNNRPHTFTWRTTKGMRNKIASLPREMGSCNQIITRAVTEFIERYENDKAAK